MKRGAFVAAANRGRYVVENLKETPSVPEALVVMYQSYTELGMNRLAAKSKEVLATNYPDIPVKTYRQEHKTLLETATFGLLGSEEEVIEVEDVHTLPSANERPWYHRATFGIFE